MPINAKVLDRKLDEYVAHANIAFHSLDIPKAKKAAGVVVVLARRQARACVDRLMATTEELRANERAVKKMGQQGITFPLVERRSELLRKQLHETKELLSMTGEQMCAALDYWQVLGATLRDLCNLCNRDYAQVVRELQKYETDWPTMKFSELVYIHNLDFKSNLGWLDYAVDAPMTHSIKEYYLDLILHTPEGRAAAHEALEATFPGIMDNALYPVTDADGVRHWYDKDGVEVATTDGREDAK